MYRFIEAAKTFDLDPGDGSVAREAARAFGRFQRLCADLPAEQLHETIPGFHHMPTRFEALVAAVEADTAGRASAVKEEIAFATAREADAHVLADLAAAGRVPLRVTHNDTKLNNVLIDDATGRGLCVIDLDTVMPGLTMVDFGDSCRSAAVTAGEDEPDLTRVHADLKMFDALAEGYLAEAHAFLTAAETDHLAFGARLVTFEQGMRFLTDYLDGDVYYKTSRPGHNLDRTRNQFKLVAEFESAAERMQAIVDTYRQ